MKQAELNAAREYIFQRVLDALLREDVRQLVSTGQIVLSEQLPEALRRASSTAAGHWLKAAHLPAGTLWISVAASRFMQCWRYGGGGVFGQRAGQSTPEAIEDTDRLLDWLASGLAAAEQALYRDYRQECRQAARQRVICLQAQRDYFKCWREQPEDLEAAPWQRRFLHYDRLAAYLDHPYYPTARAKSGFQAEDLPRYAPEFQPRFKLRWLAVPKALYHPSRVEHPAWWPSFSQVGLSEALAADYCLLPVHPFLWGGQLETMLRESGLLAQVEPAPVAYLEVVPTLSVRSLMLVDWPDTHIKLPLTIRTLGSKNMRTVKSSTIHDGHLGQTLLGAIAAQDELLRGRLLLTDESFGAHVDQRNFLGFIVRRYPAAVAHTTLVSVAGLLAPTPTGQWVVEALSERFFQGDVLAFLRTYLELTFAVHVPLWLRYGIALESNQQNSMLALDHRNGGMTLLLKDNDAFRIHRATLSARWPQLYRLVASLRDERIWTQDTLALGQMFTTITLQLNIAPLVEGLATRGYGTRAELYRLVVQALRDTLAQLPGEDAGPLFRLLLEDEWLYAKYLLTAGSLQSKALSGAADINKFYGKSAPNFLREGL